METAAQLHQELARRAVRIADGRRRRTTQRERLALLIGADDAHASLTYASDARTNEWGQVTAADYSTVTADIIAEQAADALAAIIESV
jgi:hypothetical protein